LRSTKLGIIIDSVFTKQGDPTKEHNDSEDRHHFLSHFSVFCQSLLQTLFLHKKKRKEVLHQQLMSVEKDQRLLRTERPASFSCECTRLLHSKGSDIIFNRKQGKNSPQQLRLQAMKGEESIENNGCSQRACSSWRLSLSRSTEH
jgi:hypothetical protein